MVSVSDNSRGLAAALAPNFDFRVYQAMAFKSPLFRISPVPTFAERFST